MFVEWVLEKLVGRLPPARRVDVIFLAMGMDSEEAGRKFGVRGQTVRQSLALAREELGRMIVEDPSIADGLRGLGKEGKEFW